MKKNKKIIYIASIFLMFFTIFIFFPTSKVQAAKTVLEQIDGLNGVKDKRSSRPCSVSVSIDDLIFAAQNKPDLYYSNAVAGLAGKNVSDIPDGKKY